MTIRPARPSDLARLQAIEIAAGAAFADVGMQAIADDPPPTLATLAAYQADGRAWVQVDVADVAVAYVIVERIDGCAHLEQISVHPSHARRGIGRALIAHVAAWATARGLAALTLTSFTEVPWNGPYYARCGFEFLPEAALSPGLRRIRAEEIARGLDRWPRAAMRRSLPS